MNAIRITFVYADGTKDTIAKPDRKADPKMFKAVCAKMKHRVC